MFDFCPLQKHGTKNRTNDAVVRTCVDEFSIPTRIQFRSEWNYYVDSGMFDDKNSCGGKYFGFVAR